MRRGTRIRFPFSVKHGEGWESEIRRREVMWNEWVAFGEGAVTGSEPGGPPPIDEVVKANAGSRGWLARRQATAH